jgi:hypothetical protein
LVAGRKGGGLMANFFLAGFFLWRAMSNYEKGNTSDGNWYMFCVALNIVLGLVVSTNI